MQLINIYGLPFCFEKWLDYECKQCIEHILLFNGHGVMDPTTLSPTRPSGRPQPHRPPPGPLTRRQALAKPHYENSKRVLYALHLVSHPPIHGRQQVMSIWNNNMFSSHAGIHHKPAPKKAKPMKPKANNSMKVMKKKTPKVRRAMKS